MAEKKLTRNKKRGNHETTTSDEAQTINHHSESKTMPEDMNTTDTATTEATTKKTRAPRKPIEDRDISPKSTAKLMRKAVTDFNALLAKAKEHGLTLDISMQTDEVGAVSAVTLGKITFQEEY